MELRIYRCECGKEFDNSHKFNTHCGRCEIHKNSEHKINNNFSKNYIYKTQKYKISDNLYRCECGKEFNNAFSIGAHFPHCKLHCEILNIPFKPHHNKKGSMGWENKTTEEIEQIYNKTRETLRKRYASGEITPWFKGQHHSEETKDKIRETMSKRIIKLGHRTNFSKVACEYIDKLNEDKNWHLQHAMNGGEKYVKGFFVDGYDKDLNIVFEYDEPAHYINPENNILRDKDIVRQNKIIKELNCEFWRYNEKIDKLYKVN